MKLIECYIENFGKISKQKFTFNANFNCICQDNGEGKTTLSVFIKAMFYGLTDSKRGVADNERKHYLPWGGGVCSGYLVIELDSGVYRIERTFAQKAAGDSCKVFDVTSGHECDEFGNEPGIAIFGIDAEAFERTVFHSEKNLSAKNDNQTISAKLSNLVGCDGDIGGIDKALDALMDKRKSLQKLRGTGGRIADIAAQISSNEQRLADISRIEYELSSLEDKNEQIKAQMNALTERTEQLTREHGRALLKSKQTESAQRAAAVSEQLEALNEEKNAISSFFGGKVPSIEEVEKASMYGMHAKEKHDAIRERLAYSDEYISLSEKFDKRTSSEEINEIKNARDKVKRKDAELIAERSSRFGELFSIRVPSGEEIADAIALCASKAQGKTSPIPVVMLILAVVCAAIGFFVSPVLYAVAGAALIIAIILFVLGSKRASSAKEVDNAVSDFILSVSDSLPASEDRLSTLYEMQALQKQAVVDDVADERKRLSDFAKRFSDAYGETPSIDTLLADYDGYERLKIKRSVIEESVRGERSEADRLLLISRAFLAKYKTTAENPFDEIREGVRKYNEVCASIREAQAQLTALTDGADTADDGAATRSLDEIDAEIKTSSEQHAELERQYGANIRRCSECELELLEKDDIASTLAQLREDYEAARRELDTVILTMKYLTEARDSITSKYLGKTKASFAKYVEAVSGLEGESFEMDTSFEVTKLDSGASRSVDSYSRGSRELYNIAARMAVCDSLYSDELPFLIFDDPFVALDDGKVARALELLSKISEDRQVIYFTCSRARAINT